MWRIFKKLTMICALIVTVQVSVPSVREWVAANVTTKAIARHVTDRVRLGLQKSKLGSCVVDYIVEGR